MKQIGLALLVLSVCSVAQVNKSGSMAKASKAPTADDMYCSGFITTQKVPEKLYVVAGQNSWDQDHYAGATDRVFIWGAADVKAGDRLEILSPVKNPNHYERFKGERAAIKQVGQPYFERGYVRVLEVQKNVAIAVPELSCSDFIPGDIAVPFVEREKPVLLPIPLDRYTPPNGKASGRIVAANEFDSSVGSGQKVYLSMGEDKGLRVGDYLRVTRTYDYSYHDPETSLSALATDDDDLMYHAPKFFKSGGMSGMLPGFSKGNSNLKELPRLTLGDLVVLHVHPRSATAMVVTALEDIRVGDSVELMDANSSPATAATTPTGGQKQ